MSSYSRAIPRLVEQDKKLFTCWAASLESWMSVTPQSPAHWFIETQADAIRQWSSFTGDKFGLDVKWGFRLLAAGVGMDYRAFHPASQITGAFLYSKLKTKGHVYLFFAGGTTGMGNSLGHAVVVYKMSDPWTKNCTLGVMDPWPGEGYKEHPLSDFQGANEAVVGWPE